MAQVVDNKKVFRRTLDEKEINTVPLLPFRHNGDLEKPLYYICKYSPKDTT